MSITFLKNLVSARLLSIGLLIASICMLNFSVVSAVSSPQTIYRLYNSASRQHLQTIDANEATTLTQNPVWKRETSTFSAPPVTSGSCDPGTSPIYRMVNSKSGEHFLTGDQNEFNFWTGHATDFYSEGIAFCAYATQVSGTKPVDRLYNNVTGEHFLTTDQNEISYLTSHGWSFEKIAFYAY